jgi:hypothetical protein
MWQGARKVYSYEPDPKLFRALLRNVGEQRIAEQVEPHEPAVIGKDASKVVFHPAGNASDHVRTGEIEDRMGDLGLREDAANFRRPVPECSGLRSRPRDYSLNPDLAASSANMRTVSREYSVRSLPTSESFLRISGVAVMIWQPIASA